jgi:hypothetical protein
MEREARREEEREGKRRDIPDKAEFAQEMHVLVDQSDVFSRQIYILFIS